MKYLFYFGHPAHFHLFKNVILILGERGHRIEILIKKKDVLEELLRRSGLSYQNVLRGERGESKLQMAWSLLVRDCRVFGVASSFRPDVMIGTSAEITHVGCVLGIPSIVVNEDDHDVVPLFSAMAYPLASTIVAPSSCRMGRWSPKTIFYEGYHELAYLHPDYFKPDERIGENLRAASDRYFILRFAQLNAHHDRGRTGITADVAKRLIDLLTPHGRVYISAERALDTQFEPYRIHINALDVHSALYFADIYIGDSQTMAAEAAVLGTPSLRFNDFVGEIGYLEELEHRYGLTRGIRTSEADVLFDCLQKWIAEPGLKSEWNRRQMRMLREKVDVAQFLTVLIEQYHTIPNSGRKWRTIQSRLLSPSRATTGR